MSKETSIKHNSLNINALPPPLELRPGKVGRPVSAVVPQIIKIVSRLMDMADEDYTHLTPVDRETLRDLLTCGSIAQLAQKKCKPITTIHNRASKALAAMTRQMEIWQAPHQRLKEQAKLIQVLSKALENEKKNRELVKKITNLLDVQAYKYSMLEAENQALKQEITNLKAERPLIDPQSLNNYVKADKITTRMLRRTLEEIRISSKLAYKLKGYNIETVYDLVRYSEERLTHLRIISATELQRINKSLKKTGLTLGTDVRWVEASQEYYIRK